MIALPNPVDIGKHELGTVKWFSAKKGYGFILRDNGEEIFCHFSNIQNDGFKTLHYNRRVEYEIGPGRTSDQLEAKNIYELPSAEGEEHTNVEI